MIYHLLNHHLYAIYDLIDPVSTIQVTIILRPPGLGLTSLKAV